MMAPGGSFLNSVMMESWMMFSLLYRYLGEEAHDGPRRVLPEQRHDGVLDDVQLSVIVTRQQLNNRQIKYK